MSSPLCMSGRIAADFVPSYMFAAMDAAAPRTQSGAQFCKVRYTAVPCSLPSCVTRYVAGLAAAPHGSLPIVAFGCVQGGRDGEVQQGKWLRGR